MPESPAGPPVEPSDVPAASGDPMRDHLSKAEINKDAVQSVAESAASAVGEVATIVTGAVRDVASVLGGFATELFEIRDSARKASAEHLDD